LNQPDSTGFTGFRRIPFNWTLTSKDFQDDRRNRLRMFVTAAMRSLAVRVGFGLPTSIFSASF
jgi:hypothetical protein